MFSAKRDELLKVIGHVQSVVERRSTLPILCNLKLIAGDGIVEFLATDMDICIQDSIAASVSKPFTTTVPAVTLYDIIRKIPNNADVSFEISSDQADTILIKVDQSEFNLPTIAADEFPSFENVTSGTKFVISSEILKLLLLKTKHAVSNEETRYYLNGVYLHVADNEQGEKMLRAIATDGHRLAMAQTNMPIGAEALTNGIILPKKTVGELIKLLDSYLAEVKVVINNNRILFEVGSSKIVSKLIDGKFPDYERVIPKNNDKTLEISRENLARSIDLVISVSNDKTRAVKFTIDQNKVAISASSEMNGHAKGYQEIEAKFSANEPLSIGFNSRYVLDSLSAIDGSTMTISFSNSLGAAVAKDMNDNNFLYILMPLQA